MSKDPKQFVNIFQCPDCSGELEAVDQGFRCLGCGRDILVYKGIAVFLSQEEWKNFFDNNLNFENFILDEEKDFFRSLSEQSDYLKILEMIDEYSDSDQRKKNFADMVEGLGIGIDNTEQEEAVIKAGDDTVEKGLACSPKMILDWPTGPGMCLRKLIKKSGDDPVIVSLEVNLLSIFRLKKYLESNGLADQVLFVNASASKMPFRDNTFDLVTVFGVAVETPEPDEALAETYRSMKPGALLVGNDEMYKEGSDSIKICDDNDLGALATRERFLKVVESIGFKNVDLEVAYEGYDTDDLPDEERCMLPARGDWFSFVVVKMEK